MRFDLIFNFGEIEQRALLRSERCAIVQTVEKMLIRIGAGIRIFRKSLKNTQVALGGVELLQAALDHGELVIAGGGIAADFYVAAKKRGRFRKLFRGDAKIGEFEEGVSKIGSQF